MQETDNFPGPLLEVLQELQRGGACLLQHAGRRSELFQVSDNNPRERSLPGEFARPAHRQAKQPAARPVPRGIF